MRTVPIMHWVRQHYPWRCLCFGFSHMTITRPLRLIILHFSQIFLTEGLTFIVSLHSAGSEFPDNQQFDTFIKKRGYLVLQVMRPFVRS